MLTVTFTKDLGLMVKLMEEECSVIPKDPSTMESGLMIFSMERVPSSGITTRSCTRVISSRDKRLAKVVLNTKVAPMMVTLSMANSMGKESTILPIQAKSIKDSL